MVQVQFEGVEICEDFFPLQLGKSDLILGVQWLEKLGTMITNWKLLTMKFQVDGKTVKRGNHP